MALWLSRRVFCWGAAAVAAALQVRPSLADEPILTVTGKIRGSLARKFSLAELKAEPHISFQTRTPWHADPTTFEGIGIDRLLDMVGTEGSQIRFIALNDYVVDSAIVDLRDRGGILAYQVNGKDMPISDKGPLFVVFPFDSDDRLQHQSVYARCVWQLTAIEVL